MTLPRSAADVLSEHVAFEVECIDRMYLLSELRGIAAAQKAKGPLPRAATLTGMSCSAGHDGCDRNLGATESGHPVPNGSPSFSSLPLVGTSHNRPAALSSHLDLR